MFNRKQNQLIVAAIVALVAEVTVPAFSGIAKAAVPQFSSAFVRLEHHKANTNTGGTVCAKTSVADSSNYVNVRFPTVATGITNDFTVGTTTTNWVVDTNADPDGVNGKYWPTGALPWPNIVTTGATSVTGKTVRWATPSASLLAATTYCFNFHAGTDVAKTLKTGDTGYQEAANASGSVATYATNVAVTPNEQSLWATAVVDDDTITVTAVVPPMFQIQFLTDGDGANVDTFTSNLDPSNVTATNGQTIKFITNAKAGWIAWVKDSNQGLRSVTANHTIPSVGYNGGSPTTMVSGTEAYSLTAALVSGNLDSCGTGFGGFAIDGEYAGDATHGGALLANFQPVASCTGNAPATADDDRITLTELATIRGGTPAGTDYTDVLTVVGAGNF